jgi:hypothetical protein
MIDAPNFAPVLLFATIKHVRFRTILEYELSESNVSLLPHDLIKLVVI